PLKDRREHGFVLETHCTLLPVTERIPGRRACLRFGWRLLEASRRTRERPACPALGLQRNNRRKVPQIASYLWASTPRPHAAAAGGPAPKIGRASCREVASVAAGA